MRVLSLCGVIGFMLVTVGGCADKQGAPENAVAKQTTSTRAAPDSPDKEGGKIGLPGEPVAGAEERLLSKDKASAPMAGPKGPGGGFTTEEKKSSDTTKSAES